MCLCVRNGHMIIHSHETIEESVSYYGKICVYMCAFYYVV